MITSPTPGVHLRCNFLCLTAPILPTLLRAILYGVIYHSLHAPSLVVLDDLDKIAPVEGDEGGPFNAQAMRIAEKLEDLLASGKSVHAMPAPPQPPPVPPFSRLHHQTYRSSG